MIYVMSDIHGNKNAFDSIMSQINLQENDHLYILGDVIDRGDYGIQLLQEIMNIPNAHMLLGNHEYMMMDALNFPYEPDGCTADIPIYTKRIQWFDNGGNVTYNAWLNLSFEEKSKIKEYLKNLPLEYDIDVNGKLFKLVHAAPSEIYDILEDEFINESRAYFSVWDRELILAMADCDDFITIFGHTPTHNFTESMPMKIYHNRNIIGIDCGAAYQKDLGNEYCRLSCIRLDDMKEFYSE